MGEIGLCRVLGGGAKGRGVSPHRFFVSLQPGLRVCLRGTGSLLRFLFNGRSAQWKIGNGWLDLEIICAPSDNLCTRICGHKLFVLLQTI